MKLVAYSISIILFTKLSKTKVFTKILIVLSLFLNLEMMSQTPAFPTAEGFGKFTTGGRGGKVIKVTNLNNSGEGSLREALLDTETRTIIFEISGTIVLSSMIELVEENSNFTVAGQSAPEGGITISGKPIQMGGGYSRGQEPCNNAIWRHVRFRNGSYTGQSDQYMHNGFISNGTDGLVFDHCSFSFNDDQAMSMASYYGDLTNITVQHCIFSENATGIIAGLFAPFKQGRMSFINNLFADQGHRTPNIGGNLQFDVINNVYFNWGSRLVNINADNPDLNYIGNYLKPGNHTSNNAANKVQNVNPTIYAAGNYHTTLGNNEPALWQDKSSGNPLPNNMFVATQFPMFDPDQVVVSAQEAYDEVLADVGANKYINGQGVFTYYADSFDELKINNVKNNISTDPFNKSWTLPNIPNNARPAGFDTDQDGMPDYWETLNNLDLNDPSDRNFVQPDGYTNLEYYLNGMVLDTTFRINIGTDQSICIGETITLTANNAQSYLWSTGDTTSSITVTPTATTTYSLTATDSNGDTSSDSVIITVNPIPVANAGADVEICQGDEVVLTASGGDSYLWGSGATTQSITVSPNNTSSYSVTVTQNSCSSDDQVTVTVKPRQSINAGNDVDIYLGESTTLTVVGVGDVLWSTGETTASITVTPLYTTTYTVDVTELNGCTATDEVKVTVIGSVEPNAGTDIVICAGESTTLTASGGESYLWSSGETTESITVIPQLTTTYTVEVSNAISTGSDAVTVYVNEIPNVDAGTDEIINIGEYVTLSAAGADSYLWSNGATQPNIAVSPQQTTTYYVTGYSNNCSAIANVTVNVNNAISASAGQNQSICNGEIATLTASGGANYLWSTGETTESIEVSPIEDTEYTVIVSNSVASATANVSVIVQNCEVEEETLEYVVYPNPTSNGKLHIQMSGLTMDSSLYIHDGIGRLIHFEDFGANDGQVIQKELNIARFSSGMYFVTLAENGRTRTKKIIFQ